MGARYVTSGQASWPMQHYGRPRRRGAGLRPLSRWPEAFEYEPHGHRALPDCGHGPLDRSAADIADGEDSRPAGFQEHGHPVRVVELSLRDVAAGEQEPVGVFGELARQPLGAGLCADENEQVADGQCRRLLPRGIEELHAV